MADVTTDVVCQPGDEYLLDPESAYHFYQCSNGVPIRMSCPEGIVFDPTVRPGPACDFSQNVSVDANPAPR